MDNDKNASSRVSETEPVKVTPHDLRLAAWTCSLGSALEYYDFALYSLASALIFGPLFFPSRHTVSPRSKVLAPTSLASLYAHWVASSLERSVIDSAESSC
jgi:hypothetical protein